MVVFRDDERDEYAMSVVVVPQLQLSQDPSWHRDFHMVKEERVRKGKEDKETVMLRLLLTTNFWMGYLIGLLLLLWWWWWWEEASEVLIRDD
jgi:hypothetical protein